ncbi:MAG: hypothetical protein QCI38_05800, partial [Candidatus Thermoplasmatota archaeon]|nr:hypothetical protein [Candidatus Thermoplasmatota archaeon]
MAETPAVGIRREDKNRWERRTPIVPKHVKELRQQHEIEFVVQHSDNRAFSEADYEDAGAEIVAGTPDTQVIFGVKEMPLEVFKPGKTYVFFSHVIKGQKYNMPMLKRMMDQSCTLIDYEKIADEHNRRLVFFGREAGQAGMIDSLWALGRRLEYEGWDTPFSDVEQTIGYEGLEDAKEHIASVGERIKKEGLSDELCPMIIGFAGYGNVSLGAQDVFDVLPHETIQPHEVLELEKSGEYANNVLYKVVFKEKHMAELKTGAPEAFDLQHYYKNPEQYRGTFEKYVPHLTLLMNCIYWDERYPRLVTKAKVREIYGQTEHPTFRVVGDISCDYEGSIEATIHATDPDHPTFVYAPSTD